MRKKAIIALLLAFIMLAAACAGPGARQPQAPAPDGPSGLVPGVLPIVTEPLTLTMWAHLGRSAITLTSFDDMIAYQELQARTGITLDFLHPPVGGETESFNLMIASRDFPDMIEHSWRTLPGGPGLFIADEVIISFCDWLDYIPNLLSWYEQLPDALLQATMDCGSQYMFPNMFVDPELQHSSGFLIRYDWLQYLGADEPITLDDWVALLRLVRDSTIDGHSDIIPLTIQGIGQVNSLHPFIGAWGITTRWVNENGTIVFGPTDPRFVEWLEFMNGLFEEGLLDPNFAANAARDIDELAMNNMVFALMGAMGTAVTRYTQAMRPTNPDFTLMAQYYPVMNRGDRPLIGYRSFIAPGNGTAITTANRHVAETMLLMDYNFSWDGMILGNFGIEGVTFDFVSHQDSPLPSSRADGRGPAVPIYTELILNHPDGIDIATAISKYAFHSGASALPKPNWVVNQRDSLPEQLFGRQRFMYSLNELLLPPLLPTLDESHEFGHLMNTINAFVDEWTVNFIMGRTPLSEYDTFVATLNGMGLERAKEIMQDQMDRFSGRPSTVIR